MLRDADNELVSHCCRCYGRREWFGVKSACGKLVISSFYMETTDFYSRDHLRHRKLVDLFLNTFACCIKEQRQGDSLFSLRP